MTTTKERSVRFADHEEVFIIREEGEDESYFFGLSDRSSSQRENVPAIPIITDEVDVDKLQESMMQMSASEQSAENDDTPSFLELRERMQECVVKWCKSPYWKLLEGCIDDEDGEAKDVQKYITSYARVQAEDDGDVPRGLERQLCRSHHEARKILADNATQAVLSNDFRLRYEEKMSDEEVWKELRHIYKDASRGAKTFARKMGKADEAAVQRGPVTEEACLKLIEELQERTRKGALRVKRCASMTEVTKRSSSSSHHHHHKEKVHKTVSESATKRSSRSPKTDHHHLSGDDSTAAMSPKGSKAVPPKRKTPLRFPSMRTMSTGSNHTRDSKDTDNKKDDNKTTDQEDSSEETGAGDDHTADLFHEVDKKGKTKKSSRWRSLKKRFSKTVNGERNPRPQ